VAELVQLLEGEHLIWEDAAGPYAVYLVEWSEEGREV
jgi:hypothetical protein